MAQFDEEEIEKSPADMTSEDLSQLPGQDSTDEEAGKEYDASEEIGQEAAGMPVDEESVTRPLQAPLSEMTQAQANPHLDRYQAFMDQYKALQNQRQKGLLTAGLFQGAGQIGQAMAGKYSGNFKPDESGIETMRQLANQPVADFESGQKVQKLGTELQDEQAMRDPDSAVSKTYRQYAKERLKLDLKDDVSAFDLQNLLKAAGKPQASKFATHPMINQQTGEKIEAKVDMTTGQAYDLNNNPLDRNWIRNYADKATKNPNTKELNVFSPATGRITKELSGPNIREQIEPKQMKDSSEVWESLDQSNRDRVDKEYKPAFNKLVEKPLQRLGHVPAIMERLKEAQINPAALGQLKAEMTRFDVGDNRLAQQEFEMFAKRHGYKGWADWVQDKSTGTVSADFANDFTKTIQSTAKALKQDVDKKALDQAKLLNARLPKDQKVDPNLIAPLIYGEFEPPSKKIVRKGYNKDTDQTQLIYDDGTKEIVNGRQ